MGQTIQPLEELNIFEEMSKLVEEDLISDREAGFMMGFLGC